LISVTVSFVAQANRAGAMALFLAAFPAPAERLPISRRRKELLGSDGDERAFAGAVAPALSPTIDLPAARSTRDEGFWSKSTKPLRFEWARELYRVRNQFAHGRLVARPRVDGSERGGSGLRVLEIGRRRLRMRLVIDS
jgi:hypothetical protein